MCTCSKILQLDVGDTVEDELATATDELLTHLRQSPSLLRRSKFKIQVKPNQVSAGKIRQSVEARTSQSVISFVEDIQSGKTDLWTPTCRPSFNETQRNLLRSPLYQAIDTCLRLDLDLYHANVLRRFSAVVASDLGKHGYEDSTIAKSFQDAGLHLDMNLETLCKKIYDVKNEGSRIRMITDRLGGLGAAFFLPDIISHWKLCKIPKSGQAMDKIVGELRQAGIAEQSAGYHPLAERCVSLKTGRYAQQIPEPNRRANPRRRTLSPTAGNRSSEKKKKPCLSSHHQSLTKHTASTTQVYPLELPMPMIHTGWDGSLYVQAPLGQNSSSTDARDVPEPPLEAQKIWDYYVRRPAQSEFDLCEDTGQVPVPPPETQVIWEQFICQ